MHNDRATDGEIIQDLTATGTLVRGDLNKSV